MSGASPERAAAPEERDLNGGEVFFESCSLLTVHGIAFEDDGEEPAYPDSPGSIEVDFRVPRRVWKRILRALRPRIVPSVATLVRRVCYGGRKGRSAERRLRAASARETLQIVTPTLRIGTPAYERWALFEARSTKSVTVAGAGGVWTFGGPPRGATRAQKVEWFTATRTVWPLLAETP